MKIVARAQDPELQQSLTAAAAQLGAELIMIRGGEGDRTEELIDALRTHPDILLVEYALAGSIRDLRAETRDGGVALVVACRDDTDADRVARAEVDEWILLPADPREIVTRLRAAAIRGDWGERNNEASRTAEHLRYEELLYDRFTGFPTLPVMMERGREMLDRTGRITILYIEFVRYSKLEEIYGWQKLDEVLQTTANAVRQFYDREQGSEENLLMVSHAGDDDFIFLTDLRGGQDTMERRINEIGEQLESDLRAAIEEEHGEDIGGLFTIYVGAATIFRNPKIRTERNIYRGIREAAQAARSVEHRERSRKISDLKTTLREGAVYIEYHPIVVTATGEVYGYEALARGAIRGSDRQR